jgi:protease-4
MTDKEELMLQAVVMDGYEQFVEAVAEGRGMDREEVYNIADGSLFTGLQAYNLGLVDTLGGLAQAIELAADLAGIDRDAGVVTPRQRKTGYWSDILTGLLGRLGHEVGVSSIGPKLMYLYR